jgi:hypothetical protein
VLCCAHWNSRAKAVRIVHLRALRTRSINPLCSARGYNLVVDANNGEPFPVSPLLCLWLPTAIVRQGDSSRPRAAFAELKEERHGNPEIGKILGAISFTSAHGVTQLLGIPVFLDTDYKLVAKMTERLLECVWRQVSAKGVQRLGMLADRLAVGARS